MMALANLGAVSSLAIIGMVFGVLLDACSIATLASEVAPVEASNIATSKIVVALIFISPLNLVVIFMMESYI